MNEVHRPTCHLQLQMERENSPRRKKEVKISGQGDHGTHSTLAMSSLQSMKPSPVSPGVENIPWPGSSVYDPGIKKEEKWLQ